MSEKQLVLAIYGSEAEADDAADALKQWDKETDEVNAQAVGILVLDDNGKLKEHKVGPRHTGMGAGVGVMLALVMPVGLIAGAIAGGALGALVHKGIGLSDEDRDRIGRELAGGKAAVGVVADPTESAAIAAKLGELGGSPETHDLDDAAVAEVDAAASADATASTEAASS